MQTVCVLPETDIARVRRDKRRAETIARQFNIRARDVYAIKRDPFYKHLPVWWRTKQVLHPDEVQEIRHDKRTCALVAKDYNISRAMVSRIQRRLAWKQLPEVAEPPRPIMAEMDMLVVIHNGDEAMRGLRVFMPADCFAAQDAAKRISDVLSKAFVTRDVAGQN